ERLRDSRNEVLSSISVLGSLVDDVRREGGHDRLAQERRLESLQNALDQNRALVAEAASSQSIDNGQFKAQLAELRQQLIQAVATEERVRSL
ncbi:SAM-dependent methyltransferase, partial [Stenotrophomonas maltophilia]